MVDTLKGIEPGDIIMGADFHYKVYKIDRKAALVPYYRQFASGEVFYTSYRRFADDVSKPVFCIQDIIFKSVATTWSGPAKSSDCKHVHLCLFVDGDHAAYDAWLATFKRMHIHDASDVVVSSDVNRPKGLVPPKRYKKIDLICAVILAHGPSTKDDVLRRVAAIEGKPWVVGSNGDYFRVERQMEGCIKEFGKSGAKMTFYVTETGVTRGSLVLADIGLETVQALA